MIVDYLLLPPMDTTTTSHDFGHVHRLDDTKEAVLVFPGNCQRPRLRVRKINSVVVSYVRGDVRRSVENGRRAYHYCHQQGYSVRVVCFSIGAGLFSEGYSPAWAAVRSVTLLAPLPNLKDLSRRKVGSLVTFLFVGNMLATKDNLAKKLPRTVACTIVHGVKDEVIPHDLSVEMYSLLKHSGKDVRIRLLEGKGHNDLPWLL